MVLAFISFALFAFRFTHVESITPARSVFGGHVAVLFEQEFRERMKCARTERVRSGPGSQVRVKLSECFDKPSKRIDASEFGDSMAGSS